MRPSGRRPDELRRVQFTPHFTRHAEASDAHPSRRSATAFAQRIRPASSSTTTRSDTSDNSATASRWRAIRIRIDRIPACLNRTRVGMLFAAVGAGGIG